MGGFFLFCAVGLFRKKVSLNMLINYAAGIAIFSFGLYALSNLIR